MATIPQALRRRLLDEYRLPGWELRHARRKAYVTSALADWIDATPALMDQSRAIGRRLLIDHLEQLLCDFRCALRPPAGDVRRMMPTREGVLSVHAPGLRVYGWCCGPGILVASAAALETETKTVKSLNDKKRDEVLDFLARNELLGTILRGEIYELFPNGS